jgi:hypothetical protein
MGSKNKMDREVAMVQRLVKVSILLSSFIIFHNTVYANSSWHWLTASPRELLPYVIVLTLGIEIAGLLIFGTLNRDLITKVKAAIIVTIANMVSFLLPYIIRAIQFRGVSSEPWYDSFTKGPYYIVLTGYLFLTLVIEVPMVYVYVRKFSQNRRVLLATITLVNVITTILVAGLERTFLKGQW